MGAGPPFDLEPVAAFGEVFARAASELLDGAQLSGPDARGGEVPFLEAADRDYQLDRQEAFRIRPDEAALVVVDLQEDFVRPSSAMCQPEAYRQLPRVRRLVDACRELNVPVVFTAATYPRTPVNDTPAFCAPVARGMLREGSEGTQIAAELAVRPDEPVIRTKHSYDAFFATELDSLLRSHRVRTVIVCGTMTNYCCEATARGAFDRGYHVVFGSDITATDSAVNHVATLRTMRRGYARVMAGEDIEEALQGRDRLHDEAVAARPAWETAGPAL